MAATSAPTSTRRSRAKSDRRTQLISAAERLVAERGYLAVRLEDIGAAVGVSGPAIYRHFPNKEALLVELLVGISTRLLAGATSVVADAEEAAAALDGLIDFHLDFALGESRPDPHSGSRSRQPAVSGQTSGPQGAAAVRRNLGGRVAAVGRALSEADARLMAHATFGLLNSTPHWSNRTQKRPRPARVPS